MRLRMFRIRLPLAILIILILSSCVTGYAIIYSTLTRHLAHGDYLRLETQYLEIEFPKSWFAWKWEDKNTTSGNSYTVLFAPVNLRAVMVFIVFDEVATQTYMKNNGLNDAFSIIIFEVKRMHNWTLQNNDAAALFFEQNSTIRVSGCEANYTIFTIKNGLMEDSTAYNMTGIVMSWIIQEINLQKVVQIIFYGEENDWNLTRDVFWEILNSTRTKM